MKEYQVEYKQVAYGIITIEANSLEEAQELLNKGKGTYNTGTAEEEIIGELEEV